MTITPYEGLSPQYLILSPENKVLRRLSTLCLFFREALDRDDMEEAERLFQTMSPLEVLYYSKTGRDWTVDLHSLPV